MTSEMTAFNDDDIDRMHQAILTGHHATDRLQEVLEAIAELNCSGCSEMCIVCLAKKTTETINDARMRYFDEE
mgnify:CR=1 FL=1